MTHSCRADLLHLLGELSLQTNDLVKAWEYLERARVILEETQKADMPTIAHSLLLFGEWHQANGEFEKARTTYEQVLTILENIVLPTHIDV